MKAVLCVDIGSTFTKVTAVDVYNERILGTARAYTDIISDVSTSIEKALDILHGQTGVLEYSARYACSSAAGGLKMIAVGLVPDLTAEAARMAALSAGARVLKTYSYELGVRDAEEISSLKPDIILLSGGTDGGNKKVILHNAGVIAGIDGEFPVVVAGNRSAAEEAASILAASGKSARICENVMPEFNTLNIGPAREVVRELFLRRIIYAKGLSKVQKTLEGILMPTPSAVLKASQLLASGVEGEGGLGDLMVLDVGGATTDVYSMTDGKPSRSGVVVKGLPEPYAKRTVEGDLGVRYSSAALVESAGIQIVAERSGMKKEEIEKYLEMLKDNPQATASRDERIGNLDYGLACTAVRLSVERHAGKLETVYTPLGPAFIQTGKDLKAVKSVIGTGGPVINSVNPLGVLLEALSDTPASVNLKPDEAKFLLDGKYIMAAMGLLGENYPKTALKIMKDELKELI